MVPRAESCNGGYQSDMITFGHTNWYYNELRSGMRIHNQRCTFCMAIQHSFMLNVTRGRGQSPLSYDKYRARIDDTNIITVKYDLTAKTYRVR